MNPHPLRWASRCAFVVALLGAPLPAPADVYRWLDERGATWYGQKPPSNARRVSRLTLEAGNVSIIPLALPHVAAGPVALPARIEPEPAPPRTDGWLAGVPPTDESWRQRCIAERRVDCDSPSAATFDFGPAFARPFR